MKSTTFLANKNFKMWMDLHSVPAVQHISFLHATYMAVHFYLVTSLLYNEQLYITAFLTYFHNFNTSTMLRIV